jgi:hypothetical protein
VTRLQDITLALFAACNFIRVFAYIPQIHKAATDMNGASAISCTTWALFLVAHLSTVAYALVNRSDWWLATCFAINALCCVAILAIAYWKGRCHARTLALRRPESDEWRSMRRATLTPPR